MKNVYDCAEAYQELLGKEYRFSLEGNLQFSIYFADRYFVHILGLEKLVDVDPIRTNKPDKLYKQILNGNISDNTLKNSRFFSKIQDRVEYFEDIFTFLDINQSNKIIVDFDKSIIDFRTLLHNTKYILYKRNGGVTSHLTIGQKKILYPETFIVEPSSRYISGQKMLDILNIEVKDYRKKKKKTK